MDVGHVVCFPSQKYPFIVETQPCLDLECSCREMGLTLREMPPPSGHPRDRLTFHMRICLQTWQECDPPPRSLEVESLAREFLARFPGPRVEELREEFEQTRAVRRQFESVILTDSPGKLVSYANVIDDDGDIRQGNSENCFFFVFEGREFLVEDQYCANPLCDCGNVHLEFWERVPTFRPRYRIQLVKRLLATFTLEGKLVETCFSKENASTSKYLLQAWVRRCSSQFAEYRRRYDAIKVIGARSFPLVTEARPPVETPTTPESLLQVDAARHSMSEPRADGWVSESRVRRNDRCPCGSGRKFKRCCARRLTTNR